MPHGPDLTGHSPRPLPHQAIERQLALLPLYITGLLLTWQLLVLLSPPGRRDAEGLVKGHDFVQFYALGTVARAHRLDLLYDSSRLNALMWDLVPEARGDAFPPLYGPQVALAFAPLAAFSYEHAVYVWLAFSALLYAAAATLIVRLARPLPMSPGLGLLLLLLAPALNVLLVAGQNTAVALLAVTVAWWALGRSRPLAAGAALGVLAFKPQLFAGAVAMLVLAGEWTLLATAAAAAAAQLGAAWVWAGTAVMRAYLGALAGPVRNAAIPEPLPEHVHGLAGTWRLALGPGRASTWLYMVTAALVLGAGAWAWRKSQRTSDRVALLLLVTVLVSPHLYVYDLAILVPALGIAASRGATAVGAAERRAWWAFAALAWFVPLLSPFALATGVQWSTPVLVGGLVLLSRARTSETTGMHRGERSSVLAGDGR